MKRRLPCHNSPPHSAHFESRRIEKTTRSFDVWEGPVPTCSAIVLTAGPVPRLTAEAARDGGSTCAFFAKKAKLNETEKIIRRDAYGSWKRLKTRRPYQGEVQHSSNLFCHHKVPRDKSLTDSRMGNLITKERKTQAQFLRRNGIGFRSGAVAASERRVLDSPWFPGWRPVASAIWPRAGNLINSAAGICRCRAGPMKSPSHPSH